jgi:hypothetical protein
LQVRHLSVQTDARPVVVAIVENLFFNLL